MEELDRLLQAAANQYKQLNEFGQRAANLRNHPKKKRTCAEGRAAAVPEATVATGVAASAAGSGSGGSAAAAAPEAPRATARRLGLLGAAFNMFFSNTATSTRLGNVLDEVPRDGWELMGSAATLTKRSEHSATGEGFVRTLTDPLVIWADLNVSYQQMIKAGPPIKLGGVVVEPDVEVTCDAGKGSLTGHGIAWVGFAPRLCLEAVGAVPWRTRCGLQLEIAVANGEWWRRELESPKEFPCRPRTQEAANPGSNAGREKQGSRQRSEEELMEHAQEVYEEVMMNPELGPEALYLARQNLCAIARAKRGGAKSRATQELEPTKEMNFIGDQMITQNSQRQEAEITLAELRAQRVAKVEEAAPGVEGQACEGAALCRGGAPGAGDYEGLGKHMGTASVEMRFGVADVMADADATADPAVAAQVQARKWGGIWQDPADSREGIIAQLGLTKGRASDAQFYSVDVDMLKGALAATSPSKSLQRGSGGPRNVGALLQSCVASERSGCQSVKSPCCDVELRALRVAALRGDVWLPRWAWDWACEIQQWILDVGCCASGWACCNSSRARGRVSRARSSIRCKLSPLDQQKWMAVRGPVGAVVAALMGVWWIPTAVARLHRPGGDRMEAPGLQASEGRALVETGCFQELLGDIAADLPRGLWAAAAERECGDNLEEDGDPWPIVMEQKRSERMGWADLDDADLDALPGAAGGASSSWEPTSDDEFEDGGYHERLASLYSWHARAGSTKLGLLRCPPPPGAAEAPCGASSRVPHALPRNLRQLPRQQFAPPPGPATMPPTYAPSVETARPCPPPRGAPDSGAAAIAHLSMPPPPPAEAPRVPLQAPQGCFGAVPPHAACKEQVRRHSSSVSTRTPSRDPLSSDSDEGESNFPVSRCGSGSQESCSSGCPGPQGAGAPRPEDSFPLCSSVHQGPDEGRLGGGRGDGDGAADPEAVQSDHVPRRGLPPPRALRLHPGC
ncbi:unnamed protein product [Prorocentrum cordatum]|uniref:Uncharacterized protein n=1 Tax=Prorocentrum cordatum TaxID=2364126 RepID=A0ABN9VMW3_9DINO|nr:unnamed protein product [Polarella glacialis]